MSEFKINPEVLASMSIHAISLNFGTEGLTQRLAIETSGLSDDNRFMINKALERARELHAIDFRGVDPYINHPLRVALRILAHYEIEDPDVICGSLLHDCVEDHFLEMDSDNPTKEGALTYVGNFFNLRISELVRAVTNPDFDDTNVKNRQYQEHLASLVLDGDPGAFVIKMSDFTDNATGIMYSEESKRKILARKYRPNVDTFEEALRQRDDLPFSQIVVSHIFEQLESTRQKLDNLIN